MKAYKGLKYKFDPKHHGVGQWIFYTYYNKEWIQFNDSFNTEVQCIKTMDWFLNN